MNEYKSFQRNVFTYFVVNVLFEDINHSTYKGER